MFGKFFSRAKAFDDVYVAKTENEKNMTVARLRWELEKLDKYALQGFEDYEEEKENVV